MQDRALRPRVGDTLVMVGTRKGAFLFWSDKGRRVWQRSHHHLGWTTHAVTYAEVYIVPSVAGGSHRG